MKHQNQKNEPWRKNWFGTLLVAAAGVWSLSVSQPVAAQDCKHRGDLDTMYCDENKDLVADTPKDSKKLKNPNTIVFTYTPVEDPAVYEKIFQPFTQDLGKCLDKRVVFYQVNSNAAEIEAMRSGRLHVGGFSTGPTAFAVNIAGAVPFAVKGTEKEYQGYNLLARKTTSASSTNRTNSQRRVLLTHTTSIRLSPRSWSNVFMTTASHRRW